MMLSLSGCWLHGKELEPHEIQTKETNSGCEWVSPIDTPDVIVDMLDKAIKDQVDKYLQIIEFKRGIERLNTGWIDNCLEE